MLAWRGTPKGRQDSQRGRQDDEMGRQDDEKGRQDDPKGRQDDNADAKGRPSDPTTQGIARAVQSLFAQGMRMTSLGIARMMRHIEAEDLPAVVNQIHRGSINLNGRDENGQSFLMVASRVGNLAIVRELLSHTDTDVKANDNDSWTALHNATKEGHLEVVSELIGRGASIEAKDMGGWTPLLWATYKGHLEVVQELVNHDANVNVKGDTHHMSCLTWAAGRGYLGIVQLLLSKDAMVNTADKYGTTPLIWAARKGHKEIVSALLEVGANVDNAGMHSWTALIIASKGGYDEVVRNLLEHNPNVNAIDKEGYTALTVAAKEGHTNIVSQLLKKDPYINLPDSAGDTSLIHAVKGGHREVVRALLKKHADSDVEGVDNKTALFWAVDKGHVSVAKMLLEYNAKTEIPSKDGDTPLLKAVRKRSVDLVELLLNHSAKVSVMDKRGETSLTIAVRAQSKRITELLLRNPKDSSLLYQPNHSGTTPYQIDAAHNKSILNQIFGARHLNSEGSIHGYDLYSSTIADVLSDPALKTPITVGLYAKWGSGKSFLLDKLQKEMKSFTQHSLSDPVFEFSKVLFLLCFFLSLVVGIVFIFTLRWEVGVGVGVGLLFLQCLFLVLVWLGSHYQDWMWAERLGTYLAIKMQFLQLLLRVVFCNEPQPLDSKEVPRVRFLFTDNARLASVVGEKSVIAMISTLCDALEEEYGTFVTRLYRVFKPSRATRDQGHYKSIFCIPYFVIVLLAILCTVAAGILIGIFGINSITDPRYTAINSVLITIAVVVGVLVISNIYTWGHIVVSLVVSPRRRVERIGSTMESLKVESVLQDLKHEVELLGQMTSCMDKFQDNTTRFVVIVDGLNSCEQDRLLTVLDTVNVLFGDMDSPFITILAVDPHVIVSGIENNLHSLFQDSSINGHDYLRNIVHLPFFLQGQAAPRSHPNYNSGKESENESGPGHKFTRQESIRASRSSLSVGKGRGRRAQHGGNRKGSVNVTQDIPNVDLSKSLMRNTYFSDINPRNMRRLMNIVGVTGRLLRANQIDYSWYRLAAWINITEQWPYRLSWIIMEIEDNEAFDNTATLKYIYEHQVLPKMPVSKDIDPLLEIDRNPRKLELFLANHKPLLNVGDLRNFLPCTINVDPYLRKLIREMMQNADNITSEYGFNPLQSLPPVGPMDMNMLGVPSAGGGSSRSSSLRRHSLMDHLSPRDTTSRKGSMTPRNLTPLPFGMTPQAQAQLAMAVMSQTRNPSNLTNQPQGQPTTTPSPRILQLQGGTQDITLSLLDVDGVCGLLEKIQGINRKKLSVYKECLTENNINGVVLQQCDLLELKAELKMAFGDWELFRSLVEMLRNNRRPSLVDDPIDEEHDEANSPQIQFTSDLYPEENPRLQTPTPLYPMQSIVEQRSRNNSETVSVDFQQERNTAQPSPSQQSRPCSRRSLVHEDLVDEYIYETQSIRGVMENMGMTDDECSDTGDMSPDSEVYETIIHMPDDRRPEIPAILLTSAPGNKQTSQLRSTKETSFTTPEKRMIKSPSHSKFTVSAAKEDPLEIANVDLEKRLEEKPTSQVPAASNSAYNQAAITLIESEHSRHNHSGPKKSPRYNSDSFSDSPMAATQMAVTAEINLTAGCASEVETHADEDLSPHTPGTPRSETKVTWERLDPLLIEKLSVDLEGDDPELSGLHGRNGNSHVLGQRLSEKKPVKTPATSHEHLNVDKADMVRDGTGPSAFQNVTPGSSRTSIVVVSEGSLHCDSLPLTRTVSSCITEGIDYTAMEQQAEGLNSELSQKRSKGSINKQGKDKSSCTSAASAAGTPGDVSHPGTLINGAEESVCQAGPADTVSIQV